MVRNFDLRFGDIDANTLNLDPKTIEAKITPLTKAIYLVHLGGLMADMDPIMEIAQRHNLFVVEDCAHAPGAEYKGRKVGSIGDIGCFSFHSLKNMSTLGEGGMITFNRDDWAAKVRPLSSIGAVFARQAKTEERFGPYLKSEFNYSDHSMGAFSYEAVGPVRECPVAEKVWFEQHINLPIYPTLSMEQVEYMIEKVGSAVKRVREK